MNTETGGLNSIHPSPGGNHAEHGAKMPAVVVGLDCITGLQTARILWRRGVRVIGVASDSKHFSVRTRACERVAVFPTSGTSLVRGLQALGSELQTPAVLVPCSDAAVHTISQHRVELAELYRFVLPDHGVVQQLMDKSRFQDFARQHDLPVPRCLTVRSRSELEAAATTLTFPVVVKPALKTPHWEEQTRAKAFEVETPAELNDLYNRIHTWSESLIVQEWVVGGEDALFSCNAYFDRDSRPLATFVARKLRQWPPRTGTSACGEECRNDEVLELTLRLFSVAGFSGLAYVEIKQDQRTGQLYIIEPNVGRPTGRSAIADAGGVPLIGTAYAHAAGTALPAQREQRYQGTKWIYLRHDAQAALYAKRRRTLGWMEWLRSIRGRKTFAVWSLRDPVPFFGDFVRAAGKLLAARGTRGASRRTRPIRPDASIRKSLTGPPPA